MWEQTWKIGSKWKEIWIFLVPPRFFIIFLQLKPKMFGVVFIFLANYDPKEWSHRYGEQVSLFVQGLNTDCVLEKVELMTQQFKVLGWEVAVFDSLARISPGGWVSIRLWLSHLTAKFPWIPARKLSFVTAFWLGFEQNYPVDVWPTIQRSWWHTDHAHWCCSLLNPY